MASNTTSPPTEPGPLSQRKVIVALTGGIACYKTATVVSRLTQRGADVRVLMTDAATRFITPLTLQSLSGKPVLTSTWQSDDQPESQHIGVARWADLMLIAPASADMIAKIAHGLCDDLVSLVACARKPDVPLLLAPAMNAEMWQNPIVQKNIAVLRDELKAHIVGPEEGWQACRTKGPGRMSEPETIVEAIEMSLLAGR